ncbi:co-chaperone YbbN [Paenibacillus sp. S150]|uniref:thioredoxin family protein n=1 Tax=Paenibacillus sp. S150 TaxID=2749826 RepID=UPI001C5838D6|nr:thioredoxin family protein [Paenibacillus sp. S150]MBW4082479.1 thioredoxin family protein [Paenibacillus sp. S150]
MRTEIPRKRIPHITDREFDDLTFGSGQPVLVFFGSRRCKICRQLFPVAEAVAHDFHGRMNVYGVDAGKYRPLFQRLRLRGIPQLVLFLGGEVKLRIGGFHPKEVLVDKIGQWVP